MAKRRRRQRGGESGKGSTALTVGVPPATSLMMVPLGIPNITRKFNLNYETVLDNVSIFNTPSYFIQNIKPQWTFIDGWVKQAANGGLPSNPASSLTALPAALDRDVDNIGDNLYAQTAYTEQFTQIVWPLMENLFESGVGSRYNTDINKVIKYFANVAHAYCLCYQAMVLNYLAYRFDWSVVTPFSSTVPPSIYQMVRDYDATDAGLAEYWFEIMQRIEMLTLPPALANNLQRALSPFVTMGIGRKLIIPNYAYTQSRPWDWKASSDAKPPFDEALAALEFIDSAALEETSNLIRNFLPFPMGMTAPWKPDKFPLDDPHRAAGLENMGLKSIRTFSTNDTTAWPQLDEGCQWRQAQNDAWGNLHYFSPVPGVTWGELQFAYSFAVSSATTIVNRTTKLVTPNSYEGMIILADDYKDTDNSTYLPIIAGDDFTDVASRYYKTVPTRRWLGADDYDVDYGFMTPESVVVTVPYEGALRMNRLSAESDWVYDALRQITYLGYGNALREIRPVFDELRTKTIQGLMI